MTRLSVNINKIATLRNARGGDVPCVEQVALDCTRFGAQGITVHPRPDERHIRHADVRLLREKLTVELNIEGNPTPDFMRLLVEVRPEQATLVPDAETALTSSAGWDTVTHAGHLTDIVHRLKSAGVRTSIFTGTDPRHIEGAARAGADRVELYTGPYAQGYAASREAAVRPFRAAAAFARSLGMGVNAGHDLSLANLQYLVAQIPYIDEVSIGHALIADALYFGLEATIKMYLRELHAARTTT